MTQQWKLVPVAEPTPEMRDAFARVFHDNAQADTFGPAVVAMLEAAPTPPASAQDDAKDERQAFEAWGMAGCEMVDDPQSGRFDIARHCAWEAWKARASVAAPAAGDAQSPTINIEAAAKAMAECMDYPWAHMPEQGRATMREHAQTVIRAASQQQEG